MGLRYSGLVAGVMVLTMLMLFFGQEGPARGNEAEDLLPDLVTLQPSDLHIEWRNGEKLLRFENNVANRSGGLLELAAGGEEVDCLGDGVIDNDRAVYQRVYRDNTGTGYFVRGMDTHYREEQVGCIYYHDAHGHWHFSGFASYELHAEQGKVLEGQKVSFCLMDMWRAFNLPGAPGDKYYDQDCVEPEDVQGLSPGWVDRYEASLEHQYLVINGVPDGDYCLVSTANPEGRLLETDYANNSASIAIRLSGDSVEAFPDEPCPGADAPNPGPSRDPVSPWLYDDTLHWSNWSWDTTVNPHAASPVYRGAWSMAISYNAGWAALSLHGGNFHTTGYDYLTFAVHPGGNPPPALLASVIRDEEGPKPAVPASSYATEVEGGWFLYEIPLSALGAADATITRVQIQEGAGSPQPTMYVDHVGFVASGASGEGGNGGPTPPDTPAATPPPEQQPSPMPSTPAPTAEEARAAPAPTPTPGLVSGSPENPSGDLFTIALALGTMAVAGTGLAAFLLRRPR